MTIGAIFLSASVPTAGSGTFYESASPYLIQFAVRELITTALGRRLIVWGGHPAITPMVLAACEDLEVNYEKSIVLFQSTFFNDSFPKENERFGNVNYVKGIKGDKELSLSLMREEMFKSFSYSAAVFIGGMEGVMDEYKTFSRLQPSADIIPVGASGGAALELAKALGKSEEVLESLDFSRTFYNSLNLSPADPRKALI